LGKESSSETNTELTSFRAHEDPETLEKRENGIFVKQIMEDVLKLDNVHKMTASKSDVKYSSINSCNQQDDEKNDSIENLNKQEKDTNNDVKCVTQKDHVILNSESCLISNLDTFVETSSEMHFKSKAVQLPWDVKLQCSWKKNCPSLDLEIDDEGCFSAELDDLKSGNNNFRFKINGTNYCDSSIPIISLNGETFNTISVFASTTSPIMSLSSKVNIGMTFKVTLVGNWSEEFGNVVVDCKFNENGKLCANIPKLPNGEYQFKFLINGNQFVDHSLAFKEDLFSCYNLMKILENDDVSFKF